ncbi:hypothetical protein [Qipengyuania sp. SM2507]
MSFEAALRVRLQDDPATEELLGVHPDDEAKSIDWTVRRQGAPLPAIVLETISDPRPQTHDGFDGIRPTRVQVSCLAADKTTAVALREAAIAAMVPAGTFAGVQFDRARVDAVRDLGRQTDTGFIHREAIDFIFWHKA